MDGSPFNKSIAAVGGNAWFDWKGPMIAMAKEGAETDPAYYTDMTLRDFRDVVEHLQWSLDGRGSVVNGVAANSHFAKGVLRNYGKKFWGVRVNCRKDMEEGGRQRFEAVLVPGRHPLFKEEGDDWSEVSTEMEDEICCKRYGGKRGENREAMVVDGLENEVVAELWMVIDPESEDWGRPNERWRENIGSVLLVRRRRKDLLVRDVEVLYGFIKDKVRPLVLANEGDREKVVEQITQEKLKEYQHGGLTKD